MKNLKKIRENLQGSCWKGYEAIGTKQKNGCTVPNCVPKESAIDSPPAVDVQQRPVGKGWGEQKIEETFFPVIPATVLQKIGSQGHKTEPSHEPAKHPEMHRGCTIKGKEHMDHCAIYGVEKDHYIVHHQTHGKLYRVPKSQVKIHEEYGAGFEGTPELTNKFKSMTPGQEPTVSEETVEDHEASMQFHHDKAQEAKKRGDNDAFEKHMDIKHQHAIARDKLNAEKSKREAEKKLHKEAVEEPTGDLKNACWKGYTAVGTKEKDGKTVPNCVPKNEEVDEAVESGNPHHGYSGQHPEQNAAKKFSAAHAHVKKVLGSALWKEKKPNVVVKHYLDSAHGRHLVGRENDHEYIRKDFAHFRKRYNPELHESTGLTEELHDYDVTVHHNHEDGKKTQHVYRVTKAVDHNHAGWIAMSKHKAKHGIGKGIHSSAMDAKKLTKEGWEMPLPMEPEAGVQHTESSDEDSGDYEGQMAKWQLEEIAEMASKLAENMDDDDELEAWVQEHITTAYNALDDVYSYADSNDMELDLDDEDEETPEGEDEMDYPETRMEAVEPDQQEPAYDPNSPEEKQERMRLETLIRLGLLDRSLLPVIRRSMKKLEYGQNINAPIERAALFDLLQQLVGIVTGDDLIFRKVRLDVTRNK